MKTTLYRRSGFTLVEILVVIAMMAVLASILLAVFGRVREKGRQASCQGNQKLILLAAHMYVQDNDGYFPRLYYHDIGIPAPPPASRIVTWYEALLPYTKSQAVFQCPTDGGTAIGGGWTPAPTFRSSYAASRDLLVGEDLMYNAPALMSRVKKPATTVFLADAGTQTDLDQTPPFVTSNSPSKDGAWMLWLSMNSAGTTDSGTCGPSLRHSGLSNVAFVDGHVKAMRVEQWFYNMSPWTTSEGG